MFTLQTLNSKTPVNKIRVNSLDETTLNTLDSFTFIQFTKILKFSVYNLKCFSRLSVKDFQ